MRTAAEWTRAGEWAKAKKKKAVSASRADRQLAKAGFDYFPAIIAGAGDHAACASSNVYRQYPRSEHAAPTAAASEISFDGARRIREIGQISPRIVAACIEQRRQTHSKPSGKRPFESGVEL